MYDITAIWAHSSITVDDNDDVDKAILTRQMLTFAKMTNIR